MVYIYISIVNLSTWEVRKVESFNKHIILFDLDRWIW